jgi:hypothetical protein
MNFCYFNYFCHSFIAISTSENWSRDVEMTIHEVLVEYSILDSTIREYNNSLKSEPDFDFARVVYASVR